jgi:hypothetical protein
MSYQDLPTPIPIGSPVSAPPTFDRWGLGSWRAQRTDRRDYTRRPMSCDLWLLDLSGQSVLRCKTDDISDAGLYATAPIGFGLAIGQRYEVRIAHATGAVPISPRMGASLGYGTVMRTHIELDDRNNDRIGVALRFDVPQLIPV